MQQPLAHLYFLTVLEHLQAKKYELSGLIRLANIITQQCDSLETGEVEGVILRVELQAVVQVIVHELSVHLTPSKPRIGKIQLLMDDINR